MNTRTGGPVFPTTLRPRPQAVDQSPVEHRGITLRQYYAAHAPEKVPDWFRYNTDEKPPGVPSIGGLNEGQKRQVERILAEDLDPTDAEPVVQTFWEGFIKAKNTRDEWRDQARALKFFAWRWHFADMMIQAGGEKP